MATPLRTRSFTVDEFYRMARAGVFHEDDRLELIDGQIVEMTPIGPEHAGCVKELARLLYRAAGDSVVLGVQDPVVLGPIQAPQPDIAVLRARPEGYRARHPQPPDVLLVIEVADTSVEYDRTIKFPRYARAGIPEAWLVNLPDDTIEVHKGPVGDAYTEVTTLTRGTTLMPIALPGVELKVDEILG
jgi:Uma2 family endonuclease